MNTYVNLPIHITGYCTDPVSANDPTPEPTVREYFVGDQKTPIAAAKVIRYADNNRHAGFLFDDKLYFDLTELDQAVGEYIAEQVIHAYKTLLHPLPKVIP